MWWLILLIPLAVALVIFATVARDVLRTARLRATEQLLDRHERERELAAAKLPGGRPDHPIEITTPALVEPMATAEKCLRCAGDLLLVEHTVERYNESRLRVAHLSCQRCGARRRLYFRLARERLN